MLTDIALARNADNRFDFTLEGGDIATVRGVDVIRGELRTLMWGQGSYTGDLRIGSTIARATAAPMRLWAAFVRTALNNALALMENLASYLVRTNIAKHEFAVAVKSIHTGEEINYV